MVNGTKLEMHEDQLDMLGMMLYQTKKLEFPEEEFDADQIKEQEEAFEIKEEFSESPEEPALPEEDTL